MSSKVQHDITKELTELRNQLSYAKRFGFFFGAGTSKAIGLSDISGLTKKIEKDLKATSKTHLQRIREQIKTGGTEPNIEEILNQIRLIRVLTKDSRDRAYDEISGEHAKALDLEICEKINSILIRETEGADLVHTKNFIGWLNWLSTDFVKEVFTTNYDLILERALEAQRVPYYDGFVGANEPFFIQESLETYNPDQALHHTPPRSWIRLWKVHGSLGWYWKKTKNGERRICRGRSDEPGKELVIYPSSDKYESSKQQPYACYLDRLKHFLGDTEGIMVISGYSFSDQHINSILFEGLKQNNRMHLIAFLFQDKEVQNLASHGNTFMNMSVIGPTSAIIRGTLGQWIKSRDSDLTKIFWNDSKTTLGDFREMIKFLLITSGNQEKIEQETDKNSDQ